jgi:hypothetical protein
VLRPPELASYSLHCSCSVLAERPEAVAGAATVAKAAVAVTAGALQGTAGRRLRCKRAARAQALTRKGIGQSALMAESGGAGANKIETQESAVAGRGGASLLQRVQLERRSSANLE